MSGLCRALIGSIKRRFAFVLNPNASNFDPIYALATYLHPQLAPTLSEDLIFTAKEEIHRMVNFSDLLIA